MQGASLIIVMDHKPLLGILNDRDLNNIPNPRLQSLKEKTLPYKFSVQYCQRKWQQGADAVSRYPSENSVSFFNIIRTNTTNNDHAQSYSIEEDISYSLTTKMDTLINAYVNR